MCRMSLRARRAPSAPLEEAEGLADPSAEGSARRLELADIAAKALAGVSPASREVLALRYLAGCSEADIVEALGLPLATVKGRLHEGRKQAQRELRPVVRELLSLETRSDEAVERIMARCGRPGCGCPDTLTEGR